ncbi:MAG: dihydropteroate synthase [Rhodobacteraceae bacterium]|nr:dihydropteroate synthase [Paracoccaceae bacterium]
MADYFRPLVQREAPLHAYRLAGGPLWFERVEHMRRDGFREIIPAEDIPEAVLNRLTSPRAPICGVSMDQPSIMGILNVTPDSFSDGGQHQGREVADAIKLVKDGADIIDIGGESTRPGADFVPPELEAARVLPVIEALVAKGVGPISVDTRKATVAEAALSAGAGLFNDVTALTFDPESLNVVAKSGAAVCLMHSVGTPKEMQDNPSYNNILLDVFDFLHERVEACVSAGIPRGRIMVDPGIGFGKTDAHSLALLRGLSLFHGLGCALLLGVSRKSIIGRIANAPAPERRFAGSITLGLEGLNQGVQMLRVHDIVETRQAIALWSALNIEA